MNQFAKDTGIKFVPKTGQDPNFVNIQKQTGCSSQIGKTGGAQTLSLGKYYNHFFSFSYIKQI